MLAGKNTDSVIGVDIHWEMVPAPPAPPIPTPLPNPFVGMVFDPMGLAVGLVINNVVAALSGSPPVGAVSVNMLPAANTGTEAMGFGHILIPPGTSWAPMPSVMPVVIPKEPPAEPDNPACPDDDAILITGSKTVHVMGANFCRLGDMAMSCSEPVRMPSSVLLAVPKGMPVLVGGPPTLDAFAAAGAFIRSQWVSHQLHNALSHLSSSRLRNLLSRAVCFLTGHPVDVASGRVFTDHVDFELPGPLPLKFERVYNSGFSARPGPLGYGWSHSLDQRVWEERGKVVYLTEDGREVEFDTFDFPGHRMAPGEEVFYSIDRLTLRCLGEGRWEIWTHDGVGHEFGPVPGRGAGVSVLLAKKTRDGHRIELHYDDRGHLSWVRDSGNRQLRFVHDAQGRLTSIKLPLPKGDGHFEHTRFSYDDHGDLVRVTDPLGHHWELEYSGHLLTRETDRERLSFYFGYDGIGQDAWCVRTWGDGGIYDHELVYDKQAKVTCVTNSLGHTTTYRMNLMGCVTEVIDPHGASTKYEYDPESLRRTAEIDPLGHARRYSFDERGNRTRIEEPDGAVVELDYHEAFNAPVRAIDPNGNEWAWSYDHVGRLTGNRNPHGHWSRYDYQDGRLVRATTPGGAETRLTYDDAGNVASHTAPNGALSRFTYDRLGRPVKLVNARGGVERRTLDLAGNVLEVAAPHGGRRRFEYDKEQNLLRSVDSLRDLSFAYCGYHQLHERIEAGTTIRFHYDTEDQLVAVENEAGERYRFELDERGLVRAETGFDDFTRRYTRDAAGRVLRVDKPSGRVDELSYDEAGRLTDVTHSDGTFERYRYRADGSLIEATNHSAEVHFERDEMGRVVRELTRLPDGTEDWVRSGYGPDGHRVRVEASDGHLHHIERDASGGVTRVELEGGHWGVDFERDPLGLELSRSFPGGIRATWERDLAGRPTRRTVRVGAQRALDDKHYQWEGDGQIRSILDERHGDVHYGHDARGRLLFARMPWGEEQYRATDTVGNVYRTREMQERRYGKGGRIVEADGTAYEHDETGRLVRREDVLGDLTHYRWNDAGMLVAVERDGHVVRYEYDALARRVRKTVFGHEAPEGTPEKVVEWVWDGHLPVCERLSDKSVVSWLYDPDDFALVAQINGGQISYAVLDHNDSPTHLLDSIGDVLWGGTLDIFGESIEVVGCLDCSIRWPGQFYDPDAELVYNRFRYYDPGLGIYLSQDPSGLLGGLSLYGYVLDPLIARDVLGLVEHFVRYVSEAEARQSAGNLGGDNRLHRRPHGQSLSRGPKWITERGAPARVQRTRPTHVLSIEAEDGTRAWLNQLGIDFEEVMRGEASVPDRVLRKASEPGSHGVGIDLLDQLNQKIQRINGESTGRRRGGCGR